MIVLRWPPSSYLYFFFLLINTIIINLSSSLSYHVNNLEDNDTLIIPAPGLQFTTQPKSVFRSTTPLTTSRISTPDSTTYKRTSAASPNEWHGVEENGGTGTMTIFRNPKTSTVAGSAVSTQGVTKWRTLADGTIKVTSHLIFPPEDEAIHFKAEDTTPIALDVSPHFKHPHPRKQRRLQDTDPIHVMVIYTQSAMCNAAGLTPPCANTPTNRRPIEDQIRLSVTETNQAYADTGIPGRLKLVHATPVNYDESQYSIMETLRHMQGENDGFLDGIHDKRNFYGADLVCLFYHKVDRHCGLAFLPDTDADMVPMVGFSAVHWNCASGNFSFGHELGHNLRCQHDRPTAGCAMTGCCNGGLANCYNFGHRDEVVGFRTIMSYDCTPSCSVRIQMFSSKDATFHGMSLGNEWIDNARQIRSAWGIVAGYKDGGVTECTEDEQCVDGNTCDGRETCDLEYGICVVGTPAESIGGLCDDENKCTVDECIGDGQCRHTDLSCDDDDPCTDDRCDPAVGCVHEVRPNCCGNQICEVGDETSCVTDCHSELLTFFTGTMAGDMAGNMFTIKASRDVIITGFDVHTRTSVEGADVTIKIYNRPGTYQSHELSQSSWSHLQTTTVSSGGTHTLTNLPNFDAPINMRAGDITSYYVTATTNAFLSVVGANENAIHLQNDDLVLYVGTANLFEFRGYAPGYVWSGRIRFSRPGGGTTWPTLSPSPTTSLSPTISSPPTSAKSAPPTTSITPTINFFILPPTPSPTLSSSPSNLPSFYPSHSPTLSLHPSHLPTNPPTTSLSPTSLTSCRFLNNPSTPTPPAAWMSGGWGIAIRGIYHGTNYLSSVFDIPSFVLQMQNNLAGIGVKWVILSLSGGYGDRYLAPHSLLTAMNRGSTPKTIPADEWGPDDLPLESYPDRDLFGEIIDGLLTIQVSTIAFASAQGPSVIYGGERRAYDYNNGSPYVDSCTLCPSLTGEVGCMCAPSVQRWNALVLERYGSVEDQATHSAYADLIVREYAERYGTKLKGWWFDHTAPKWDVEKLVNNVHPFNPSAILTFNRGDNTKLVMNNAPYESYTFGYQTFSFNQGWASDCINYPLIASMDHAYEGYVCEGGVASLAHIFFPVNQRHGGGTIVWEVDKAREWMGRIVGQKGAWTWGVKIGGAGARSLINSDDIDFLNDVLPGITDGSPPYHYCDTAKPSVSAIPTNNPSTIPTLSTLPSHSPSQSPSTSQSPSKAASTSPSVTLHPSLPPTSRPTRSREPSATPSLTATISANPTRDPSMSPSVTSYPSLTPTKRPSVSMSPSKRPSGKPTLSIEPTAYESHKPSHSIHPSLHPSSLPTSNPTLVPTIGPTTSQSPTNEPSTTPTVTIRPTLAQSSHPSVTTYPTRHPSLLPTMSDNPSKQPSTSPTDTSQPSLSQRPTTATPQPTGGPSVTPTGHPTTSSIPSGDPSTNPSNTPSMTPSVSVVPSTEPSVTPTRSVVPSATPSITPSRSMIPSTTPSSDPSHSAYPTMNPSHAPSSSQHPTKSPSQPPTLSTHPSLTPTQSPTTTHKPSYHPSTLPTRSVPPTISGTKKPSLTLLPSTHPTITPTVTHPPTIYHSIHPSLSTSPTTSPSTSPTLPFTDEPTTYEPTFNLFVSPPTAQPTLTPPTTTPSRLPTLSPTVKESEEPSKSPTEVPTMVPSSVPSMILPRTAWMEGGSGVAVRMSGGVNYATSYYDVDGLVEQFRENLLGYGIRWVVVTLSSPYFGDRYLAPHSVLTTLNRGSTPKAIPKGIWYYGDLPLENYQDRDLFGEILTGIRSLGIKVIAYMAAQGPAMLHAGENKSYDYGRRKSAYVNSCAICNVLSSGTIRNCACSPAVRKWKVYVKSVYDADDFRTLKKAYGEIIVKEYAARYGRTLSGFMFDQGDAADMYTLYRVIRESHPRSVIAFNRGQRVPLAQNSYPYEDFTFGLPTSLQSAPASSCRNYPAVTSLETTSEGGYFIVNGHPSLGHVFTSLNTNFDSGSVGWDVGKAVEWQRRVMNAGGAWTWVVKRGSGAQKSMLHGDDLDFLKKVYEGLRNATTVAEYRGNDC